MDLGQLLDVHGQPAERIPRGPLAVPVSRPLPPAHGDSFAPFVFAALGVPLGLRRSARVGALVAASWSASHLVAAYYTLLGFASFMGETGAHAAAIALWIPNVVFGLASIRCCAAPARHGVTIADTARLRRRERG